MLRELDCTIEEDLNTLGIVLNSTQLVFKPYSKSLYACYRAKTDKVYLYLYQDAGKTKIYDYKHYLTQVIHEMCHVIQYYDPLWVRKKNVMHDNKFWEMLDYYLLEAEQFYLFDKEVITKDDRFFTCKKNEG